MIDRLSGSAPSQHDESGFSLADFVNAWFKRWKLFAFVVLAFVIAGAVYFRFRPAQLFVYQTSMEIGATTSGTALESVDAVRERLRNSYIPEVLSAHAREHGYSDERYRVEVVESASVLRRPDVEQGWAGSTITLLSRGDERIRSDIIDIHQRIARRFLEDQERRGVWPRKDLEHRKLQEETKLDAIRDAIAAMPKKFGLIDVKSGVLRRQIESTQKTIGTLEQDRAATIAAAIGGHSFDQSLASVLLVVDSKSFDLQQSLRQFEDRLFVKLEEERSVLRGEQEEWKRKQREQERVIEDIAFQIDNFRGSRVVLSPTQLPRPQSSGALHQLLVMFGGLGSILGIFLVVFVEFISNIRRQARGS